MSLTKNDLRAQYAASVQRLRDVRDDLQHLARLALEEEQVESFQAAAVAMTRLTEAQTALGLAYRTLGIRPT